SSAPGSPRLGIDRAVLEEPRLRRRRAWPPRQEPAPPGRPLCPPLASHRHPAAGSPRGRPSAETAPCRSSSCPPCHYALSRISPERRATRTFLPSPSARAPTLVGLPLVGSTTMTLDKWMDPSRSMMPP